MKYYSGRKYAHNSKLYFPMPRRSLRSRWRRLPAYAKILAIAFVAYLGMSVYNGVQEDKAAKEVNAYAREILGYDALIDKGVVGHSWLHFINPDANFSAISRSKGARLSYAAYTGLGVWNLKDFEEPDLTPNPSTPIDQPTQNYDNLNIEVDRNVEHIKIGTDYESRFTVLFNSSFLIDQGLIIGDTYEVTISMQYKNNAGETHTTKDATFSILLGEGSQIGTGVKAIEPDCWITIDDIVDFTVSWSRP